MTLVTRSMSYREHGVWETWRDCGWNLDNDKGLLTVWEAHFDIAVEWEQICIVASSITREIIRSWIELMWSWGHSISNIFIAPHKFSNIKLWLILKLGVFLAVSLIKSKQTTVTKTASLDLIAFRIARCSEMRS